MDTGMKGARMLRKVWFAVALFFALGMLAWPILALATEHYVFGLEESPAYEVTFPDGTRDTLALPGELSGLRFRSEQRGRFEIVPVGVVPPAACPDLVVVDVLVGGVALCGDGPWLGRYKVKNVGTGDAPASTTGLSFTPPGGSSPQILPNQSCPPLPAGAVSQEFVFQIAAVIPPNADRYLVHICANKSGAFPEGPEPNCY